jgi:hypothetical protein
MPRKWGIWTEEHYRLLKEAYLSNPIVFSPILLDVHTESACKIRAKRFRIRRYRFHTIFCNQFLNNIDLSYIAAFLDGEGSIYLNEKLNKYFVSFSNSDYGVIEWMHNILECGRIETRKETIHYTKKHYIYRIARLADTIYLLSKLIPFLHIKMEKATVAIQFNLEVLNREKWLR